MDYCNVTYHPELSFLIEWENENNKIMRNDEGLSTMCDEEERKVLEQWQANQDEDRLDMMPVDEKIEGNLRGDYIYNIRCILPCGTIDAAVDAYMNIDDAAFEYEYKNISEDLKVFATLIEAVNDEERYDILLAAADIEPSSDWSSGSNNSPSTTTSLSFEERYLETLKKLSESMQRSQESRKSLMVKAIIP